MTIKKYFIALLLSISLLTNVCHAQKDNTKAFLFLSVFCDVYDSYYEQSADIVKEFHILYEEFSYECTKPLEISVSKYPRDTLRPYEKYTIQLFKIKRGPITPSYYILKLGPCDTYKFSFSETLWIRVSGYQESDLKVFFDSLTERGLRKKDIVGMVEKWRESDEMFCEIDWGCLLKGYFENNTHLGCYISGAKMMYDARYYLEDIYAIFSKGILAGTLQKFD